MPRILHLTTDQAALVWEMGPDRKLHWRHLGGLVDPGGLPPLDSTRSRTTYALDRDHGRPVAGTAAEGWFGPSALSIIGADGCELRLILLLDKAEVENGVARFTHRDRSAGIELETRFTPSPGGALTCSQSVRNDGDRPVTVRALPSAVIPLPQHSATLISWSGRHGAEFVEHVEPMPAQSWVRSTQGGITGHGGPAGVYVLAEGASFDAGLVLALQLAWSGDSELTVSRDDDGTYWLRAEAVMLPGEVVIAPGQKHQAPDAILAIAQKGRNGAMTQHHAAVRDRVAWPGEAMRPRPVHLNSWEACYFAHDEARAIALAEQAAALGAERFVLDDGWFLGRDDDRRALGDWSPDPRKYPRGLGPVADRCRSLGLTFGLWVEPEMVSPESALAKAHPDWVLGAGCEDLPTSRHQWVLDLSRPDVRDHLFTALDTLLAAAPIDYLKWDHNRHLAPAGGVRQVEGVYALLERLRSAHPGVEIESCAGGGGRCDAGIARYVHRFWTSDTLDAVARVAMQRGFLAFLPTEMMGAHVGAVPSHATGRRQALSFRAAIACQGHFGLELDPAALSLEERAELAEWIAFYRGWRSVLHAGQMSLGAGSDGVLWHAQGDSEQRLLFVIRTAPPRFGRPQPLQLPFASGRDWTVRLLRTAGEAGRWQAQEPPFFADLKHDGARFTGSWLARAGLPLPALPAEGAAIFHLKATA